MTIQLQAGKDWRDVEIPEFDDVRRIVIHSEQDVDILEVVYENYDVSTIYAEPIYHYLYETERTIYDFRTGLNALEDADFLHRKSTYDRIMDKEEEDEQILESISWFLIKANKE